MRNIFVSVALSATAITAPHIAMAQSLPSVRSTIENQVSRSDLIFKGAVVKIDQGKSIEGIIHTYVTYRVEKVVNGSYSPKTITLRFIGGEERVGNMVRGLAVSHAPSFKNGDRDILMVSKNGRSLCPLVQCARGRYQLRGGMVNSEDGAIFAKDQSGTPMALTGSSATAAANGKAVNFGNRSTASPYSEEGFVSMLSAMAVSQRGTSSAKSAASALVQSADPTKPFSAGISKPAAGPVGR
jgi:hypothetical protein